MGCAHRVVTLVLVLLLVTVAADRPRMLEYSSRTSCTCNIMFQSGDDGEFDDKRNRYVRKSVRKQLVTAFWETPGS